MTDDTLIAITEQIADWRGEDFQIQPERQQIANVLLSGGSSRNGHRYSDTALRAATPLYARKPVFLDHAANPTRPLDRSTRDLAGWIIEAQFLNGRILGTIQVLETEAGNTLLALMSSESPAVGMSHVILARKSADGTVVEQIQDVISVDAVVFPATTAGFREQQDAPDDIPDSDEQSAWITEREELLRTNAQLRAECDQLRQRIQACDAADLERAIDRELAAAELTSELVTTGLREQLRTSNTATRARLIAEHRHCLLRSRRPLPFSQARGSPDAAHKDRVLRDLVNAVKAGR